MKTIPFNPIGVTRIILIFILFFSAKTIFAVSSSTIDITLESRQIVIRCQLDLETNAIAIILPPRSHLLRINSPANPGLQITNEGNKIFLSQMNQSNIQKVNLSYSITTSHPDFSLKKWHPSLNLKMQTLLKIHAPTGYTAIPLPYQAMTADGYKTDLQENPILINARLKHESFQEKGILYELYYPFKWKTPHNNISQSFITFSKLLGKLPQTNLILLHLPNLSDQIFTNSSQIVTMIPNTDPTSVKRSLSLLWLKNKWKLKSDFLFALSDVLKRIFDNTGHIQSDDGQIIIVPRYNYYQKILKKGFPQGTLIQTDFNAMTKNFAMIHFAYYTVGISNFIAGLQKFASSTNHNFYEFKQTFTDQNNTSGAIRYVCEYLLPVASTIPDLGLKENYLYRNDNHIPDIMVQINTNTSEVNWGNRRIVDLGHVNGFVFVDPGSQIPQLNFFNDKSDTDSSKNKTKAIIREALIHHRQLANEKFRSIYNLEQFTAPKNNPWNVKEGQTIFVAITKILAPIQGGLRNAVKETILTIAPGEIKAKILASRIRF